MQAASATLEQVAQRHVASENARAAAMGWLSETMAVPSEGSSPRSATTPAGHSLPASYANSAYATPVIGTPKGDVAAIQQADLQRWASGESRV